MVLFLRLDPLWWEKAQRQFNLELNISDDEYVVWLLREDMPGGTNNLLEWFCLEVEKQKKEENGPQGRTEVCTVQHCYTTSAHRLLSK
jgi:hypothetical protein